jgi:ketosteroid isomerase-like protein
LWYTYPIRKEQSGSLAEADFMSADSSGFGNQDESPFKHEEKIPETQEEQNGENPFDQEDVPSSTPAGSGGMSGTAPGGEQSSYMPEDAVIEYGYEADEDFYDPTKQKEGEEDSVFMTEQSDDAKGQDPSPLADSLEATMPIEQDEVSPGPIAGAQTQASEYESQLDDMFPDDGFEDKGKLDWGGKKEDNVSLTESYPSMPGEPGQVDPSAMTAEMQEEGVPDSPSGYVVITPSGRKKGVSPEIAQLLERTSKRQSAISLVDTEAGSKLQHKVVTFILIILFLAASAAAGYMYNQNKKARKDFAESKLKTQQLLGDLQTKFNADLKKIEDQNTETGEKLKQTETEFASYKEEVEGKVSQFETLKDAEKQYVKVIDDLKIENEKIPELEGQVQLKDERIGALNSTIQHVQKNGDNLKAGVIGRDTTITQLRKEIEEKISDITKLGKEIEDLKGAHKGPRISPSEVASLRDSVHEKTIKINSLNKHVKDLEDQLERIQLGRGGQAEINKLIMKLVVKNEEIINLQEQIAKLQHKLRRYSSPESTISEWAKAYSSGELDRVIKHYASDNYHRKRWESGNAQQEALKKEFQEFTAKKIESEVISITLNPQDSTATAKLKLRLSADGKTRVVNATMLLLREYERWVILDEGF